MSLSELEAGARPLGWWMSGLGALGPGDWLHVVVGLERVTLDTSSRRAWRGRRYT